MSESPLPQPDLQRIGQLALPVADLDRSVAFYRDQLGLRFLFQAPRAPRAASVSSPPPTWSPDSPTAKSGWPSSATPTAASSP